jgi:ABC-type Na+ transport system ATPase subunit NatA
MIDNESLTKKFGDLIAVKNLTLHVDEGLVLKFTFGFGFGG